MGAKQIWLLNPALDPERALELQNEFPLLVEDDDNVVSMSMDGVHAVRVLKPRYFRRRLIVKEHRFRNPLKALAAARRTPAEDEFETLLGLATRNIDTAQPIGCALEKSMGLVRRTFLIREQLEGYERLDIVWRRQVIGGIGQGLHRNLLRGLAAFLTHLFMQQVYHPGLRPQIIMARFIPYKGYKFALTDAAGVKFRAKGSRKAMAESLGSLFGQLAALGPVSVPFVEGLCRAVISHLEPESERAVFAGVRIRGAVQYESVILRRETRARGQAGGRAFTTMRPKHARAMANASRKGQQAAKALFVAAELVEDLRPETARMHQMARFLEHEFNTASQEVYGVTTYGEQTRGDGTVDRLLPWHDWQIRHGLLVRSLPVPEPLVVMQQRSGQGAIVSEGTGNYRMLADHVKRRLGGRLAGLPAHDRHALAEQLGRLFAMMHWHCIEPDGDIMDSLVVSIDPEKPARLWLSESCAVRFNLRLDGAGMLTDLVKLRSLLEGITAVSNAEVFRFLRTYFQGTRSPMACARHLMEGNDSEELLEETFPRLITSGPSVEKAMPRRVSRK